MKVEVLHHQTLFEFHEHHLIRLTRWIMGKVVELKPSIDWQELTLVLMDDRIKNLNETWFKKNTITDVISFAYPEPPATGEVVVNVQQAFEEGILRESPDYELALYVAHGCHHLTGAKDDTPEKKKAMLDLENAWVKEAFTTSQPGPYFR